MSTDKIYCDCGCGEYVVSPTLKEAQDDIKGMRALIEKLRGDKEARGAQIQDLKWENGIQAELIAKLQEDNARLLRQLHDQNLKIMKAHEKFELTKRSLMGELTRVKTERDELKFRMDGLEK